MLGSQFEPAIYICICLYVCTRESLGKKKKKSIDKFAIDMKKKK